jgi:hypothetical protein
MGNNTELGRILSYVGGGLSLFSGIVLIFPVIGLGGIFDMIGYGLGGFQALFVVLMIMTFAGGITTLVGASRVNTDGSGKAGTIVIIGSVIGGLNWISLIGGILLKQEANKGYIHQPYSPPSSNQRPPMGSKKFCKNCGAPITEGTNFCQSCGTPI